MKPLANWFLKLIASVAGGAVLVGTAWWAVSDQERQKQIARLEAERAELIQVIARLKTERRIGRLLVVDQKRAADGAVEQTVLDFAALDGSGQAGPVQRVTIPGDVCYVDALVIRFLDDYVEKGDSLRGHSLHLFRRIFGEGQRPLDGYPLDTPGAVPVGYGIDAKQHDFERRLWRRFWQYAANPELAAENGVRVAQGEAAYQKLSKGQLWQIATRADGGLEMTPISVDPLIAERLRREPVN